MKIGIWGTASGSSGYANHCRGSAHYLRTLGEDVSLFPIQPPDKPWWKDGKIIEEVTHKRNDNEQFDVKLMITNPFYLDNFEDPTDFTLWTTFECSRIPVQWIHRMMSAKNVLATSKFAQQVFSEDGIESKVAYEGYDEHLYYPNTLPHDRFRFLTVAEWMPRKNLPKLIKTFADTFQGKNDVELFIKTWSSHGLPTGEIQQVIDYFNRGRSRIMPIYMSMPDNRMRELYAQCDVNLSATRGEGFNRSALEAMACGLPNIITGWSAHTEFVNDKNGWLVDYDLEPVLPHFIEYQEGMDWAEIKVESLSEKMMYAYQHRDEVKEKGAKGASDAKAFTWPRVTKQLIRTLEELTVKA